MRQVQAGGDGYIMRTDFCGAHEVNAVLVHVVLEVCCSNAGRHCCGIGSLLSIHSILVDLRHHLLAHAQRVLAHLEAELAVVHVRTPSPRPRLPRLLALWHRPQTGLKKASSASGVDRL